jgi:hypothetical protein
VRKLLGWDRYDSEAAVEASNDLYRHELRWLLNLYLPSVKMVKKTRVGSKLRRVYDAPQTPLERVARSGYAEPSRLAELTKLKSRLDPFELARTIDRKLKRIYELANRRLSPSRMGQTPCPSERGSNRGNEPAMHARRARATFDGAKTKGVSSINGGFFIHCL